MTEPVLTEEQFSKLSTKMQLSVIYRTLKLDATDTRVVRDEVKRLRYYNRFLMASDAALWAYVVWAVLK